MSKRIEENENTQLIYEDDGYKKANALISAKYKSTLMENKLLAFSLSKINEAVVEETEIEGSKMKVLTSTLYSSELRKVLGANSKSLPRQLKDTYVRMAGRQIGIENEKGEFSYRSLVIGADYDNGVMKIYYNPLLNTYYQELSKNYTILSLSTMMSFRSSHSFRLYEILKSHCYVSKKDEMACGKNIKERIHIIPYSVSELKLELGVVNAELAVVKAELSKAKGGHPNYDRAVEISQEKNFNLWSRFKRQVLDPAIKEINEKTEMEVDYELEKSGKGGKVHGVEFRVKIKNTEYEQVPEEIIIELEPLTQDAQEEIQDAVRDIIDVKLKTKDIRSICEAADYNLEKIQKAYNVMMQQTGEIANVTGFLIKAITEGYEEAVPAKKKNEKKENVSENSSRKKNTFTSYRQRQYTDEEWKEIEKAFLNRED